MILVTGGTGFVGRRVVAELCRDHDPSDIWCLFYDRGVESVESSGQRFVRDLGVRWSPGDLVTGRGLEALPRSPDVLVHLAACSDSAARDHRVNDVGTSNLLTAVGPLEPTATVVFTSSIAVSDHRRTMSAPATESTELLRPRTDYGRRKLAAEHLLEVAALRDGFALTTFRLGVVHGPGVRRSGFIDQVVAHTLAERLRARFDYPSRFALVHVDDIASIVASRVRTRSEPGEMTLHLPVGEVLTGGQLFALAHEALGVPYRAIRLPHWFWRAVAGVARIGHSAERLLPHRVHNRVWQLGLLADDGLFASSERPDAVCPDGGYRSVSSSFAEIAGESPG